MSNTATGGDRKKSAQNTTRGGARRLRAPLARVSTSQLGDIRPMLPPSGTASGRALAPPLAMRPSALPPLVAAYGVKHVPAVERMIVPRSIRSRRVCALHIRLCVAAAALAQQGLVKV